MLVRSGKIDFLWLMSVSFDRLVLLGMQCLLSRFRYQKVSSLLGMQCLLSRFRYQKVSSDSVFLWCVCGVGSGILYFSLSCIKVSECFFKSCSFDLSDI